MFDADPYGSIVPEITDYDLHKMHNERTIAAMHLEGVRGLYKKVSPDRGILGLLLYFVDPQTQAIADICQRQIKIKEKERRDEVNASRSLQGARLGNGRSLESD
ncbi:MAG: hypothetical protein ACP5NS_00750 [Candidatus Pacearchaeota archaeon]